MNDVKLNESNKIFNYREYYYSIKPTWTSWIGNTGDAPRLMPVATCPKCAGGVWVVLMPAVAFTRLKCKIIFIL